MGLRPGRQLNAAPATPMQPGSVPPGRDGLITYAQCHIRHLVPGPPAAILGIV